MMLYPGFSRVYGVHNMAQQPFAAPCPVGLTLHNANANNNNNQVIRLHAARPVTACAP